MTPAKQAPGPPARVPRPKVLALALVAALVLALDATSKALVVANLTPGEPVHVIGNVLMWDLLRNPGAAWSIGPGYTAVFTLLAIGVVVYVIRTARRLHSIGHAIAFGLLLGGAMGNLSDRMLRSPGVFRGDVVDWIEVTRYYPVFNLADSSICIAAVIFVILALRGIRMDGSISQGGFAAPNSQGGFAAPSTPLRGETPLTPPSPGEPPAQTAGAPGPPADEAGEGTDETGEGTAEAPDTAPADADR